jgi:Ni/Co efflux regulator RcnB
MKKLVLAAATVVVATMSLAHSALADGRNNGDEWRHGGRHTENRDRDGDNWDRGGRHNDRRDDWRRDRWRHHHGWRHDGWRGGPRVIIRPGFYEPYCFIKKVRRYDDWGNVYIKRIRVCR